jgi:GAF domain-containing protein
VSEEDRSARAAEVANALNIALAPLGDDLVEWTARTARAVFGASACSIALLSADGTELVFTTATGGAEASVSGLRMPAGEGIAGWVATTGQPLAVDDLTGDPRFAANVAESTGYIPQAILASPIETGERLLGVIEILDRDPDRAGASDDLALLELFAHQAALALDAAARARRIGDIVVATLSDDPSTSATTDGADDDGMHALASAFAVLASRGSRERDLALAVLGNVADYARSSRR